MATQCAFNYVVTAHKPTNVTQSVIGNFTGSTDINLIISCASQAELASSGLLSTRVLTGCAPIAGNVPGSRYTRSRPMAYRCFLHISLRCMQQPCSRMHDLQTPMVSWLACCRESQTWASTGGSPPWSSSGHLCAPADPSSRGVAWSSTDTAPCASAGAQQGPALPLH
jgi:hypothetical protein